MLLAVQCLDVHWFLIRKSLKVIMLKLQSTANTRNGERFKVVVS
uniref:Uncharacterized protein n=1 Tax=Ciona intestinalis TaxID=7719 RepID=H2XZ94_CIOIN